MQVTAHRPRLGLPSRARAAALLAPSCAASPRLGGQGSRQRARGWASPERGLSEEDVALALREREAAQAAANAAGAASAAQAALGAGAPIQGGEALSADDAAELARDTIPRRGPLALPRVVAATKPRMQGVALPVAEHDPSLASAPGARGERSESAAVPAGRRRVWALALLVLGAGALALWWWSKRADPPPEPSGATSATPAASTSVASPAATATATADATAPASASVTAQQTAAPQVAPSTRVSASVSAAVPSAKASAKPSATAQASTGPKPSAAPPQSATPTATTSTGGIYILEGDP